MMVVNSYITLKNYKIIAVLSLTTVQNVGLYPCVLYTVTFILICIIGSIYLVWLFGNF